ncbi:hypothetical protein [Frigoribacterium sp. VKM Ac-2530]|uniref:hypothetical protein n=1 Tax=Frigoribacterium sp. VKM Ac-2530 TaxID=2783822 RepID=UPI00188BB6A2|nr:hypothetical protein [Frigoribacterium sp. VKM Ac-2530]MBF4578938.1 hypothetical protein [Frigoribacterium sp. VKM Ac-2530]
MTTAETLRAAIAKLTEQRDAAMKGPWRHIALNYWGAPTPGIWADGEDSEVGYPFNQPDANLLVTLHATIDAQIELLKLAIDYGDLQVGRGSQFIAHAHELATAILGEQVTE